MTGSLTYLLLKVLDPLDWVGIGSQSKAFNGIIRTLWFGWVTRYANGLNSSRRRHDKLTHSQRELGR